MILKELIELLENIPEKVQRDIYLELIRRPIKRRYIRRPLYKEIGYVVAGVEYIDMVRDVSFEGVFIETRNRFVVGQTVQLEIPMINSPKFIRTTGVIVRVTQNGVGIKFTKEKKYDHEPAGQDNPKPE
jgi:hypothetical protein